MNLSKVDIRCECGEVRGQVEQPGAYATNRAVCYCSDCQAFAHYLGKADMVLDAHGGSDVFQVSQGRVRIHRGIEHLACVDLTGRGLLRWYASCCNTPIGNTPGRWLAFIGMLRNCIHVSDSEADRVLGPVRGYVFTDDAIGDDVPKGGATISMVLKFVALILLSKLRGEIKQSPFFRLNDKAPISEPHVLSDEERGKLPPYVAKMNT